MKDEALAGVTISPQQSFVLVTQILVRLFALQHPLLDPVVKKMRIKDVQFATVAVSYELSPSAKQANRKYLESIPARITKGQ